MKTKTSTPITRRFFGSIRSKALIATFLLAVCALPSAAHGKSKEGQSKMNLVIDRATTKESKGTILLIHGTAPQNIDGQLPVERVQKLLKEKDPSHYIIQPTYRNLAKELNALGWDTVRYTRLGVYQDHVDAAEYSKTDLKNIMGQLNSIWKELPKNKPRVVFAWSGGSIHVLQLPLSEASAVIILGGIATKRTEVMKLRAKDKQELAQIEKEMDGVVKAEGKIPRTDMVGLDMPYGRFWDENHLNDNWTYLRKLHNLLHSLQGFPTIGKNQRYVADCERFKCPKIKCASALVARRGINEYEQ